jgi:hypothetical protein
LAIKNGQRYLLKVLEENNGRVREALSNKPTQGGRNFNLPEMNSFRADQASSCQIYQVLEEFSANSGR